MDSGISIGDTMEEREYITHEEWHRVAMVTVRLLSGSLMSTVTWLGRLRVEIPLRITIGHNGPRENSVQVSGYDYYIAPFWYSLQDAIECLTGERFDDGTPRYVMLDYMEERGYIS